MIKKDLTPLVIKAQTGNREDMNRLMQECYETLYYYAYNTVKNEDLAADITQESCIEIINTLGKLRDPKAFRTWSGRIVYHKCAAYFRQTQEVVVQDEDMDILERLPDERRDSLPEQIQEDKEFQKLIWQMLDALPAEQRQALMLYYLENMSVGEIAEIQGKTPGTVKSRLNYGRKAVIAQVDAYEKKTGVRLHSLTPLPLLLFGLFRDNRIQTGKSAAQALLRFTRSAAAKTAVVAAGKGISAKIIAGIAAVAIVGGSVAGGIALFGEKPKDTRQDTKQETQEDPRDDALEDIQGDAQQHIHNYSARYQIVSEGHQGICQCGQLDSVQVHTYQQGRCVCGTIPSSQGLQIDRYDSYCVVSGIGSCTDSHVVIPSYYEGLPVTAIGQSAFQQCKSITEVSIPETVTTIKQWAFYDCENLEKVHFSEGLKKMEDLVFIWCVSLTEITFPDSLTDMGHSIFNECSNLKTVKLPKNLTVLQRGVFSNCDSLETVMIPAGMTSIGDKAFWHCTNLSQLYFEGTKVQWQAIEKGHENTWEKDGTYWDTDTGDYVVVCSDGELSKQEAK